MANVVIAARGSNQYTTEKNGNARREWLVAATAQNFAGGVGPGTFRFFGGASQLRGAVVVVAFVAFSAFCLGVLAVFAVFAVLLVCCLVRPLWVGLSRVVGFVLLSWLAVLALVCSSRAVVSVGGGSWVVCWASSSSAPGAGLGWAWSWRWGLRRVLRPAG